MGFYEIHPDVGTILATTDGGTTWNVQSSDSADDLGSVAFADADDGGRWVATTTPAPLSFSATTDGGTTWSPQGSSDAGALAAVAVSGAKDGWVVGQGGAILATDKRRSVARGLKDSDTPSRSRAGR